MTRLFQNEMEELEKRLQSEATLVEEAVKKAVKAFESRDPDLAQEVITGDGEIDNEEVDIEQECLKILALYQPVAQDLRIVVAALKINNDLERVGDLAKNIAKRVSILTEHPDIRLPFDFHTMASGALDVLKQSLDAFSKFDSDLAEQALPMDTKVDDHERDATKRIVEAMRAQPEADEAFLQFFAVVRALERLGDLATNIAEDIIYIQQGVIVRHRKDKGENGADSQ